MFWFFSEEGFKRNAGADNQDKLSDKHHHQKHVVNSPAAWLRALFVRARGALRHGGAASKAREHEKQDTRPAKSPKKRKKRPRHETQPEKKRKDAAASFLFFLPPL